MVVSQHRLDLLQFISSNLSARAGATISTHTLHREGIQITGLRGMNPARHRATMFQPKRGWGERNRQKNPSRHTSELVMVEVFN